MRQFLRYLLPVALLFMHSLAGAQEVSPLSAGQSLYLPIYSHLYHGDMYPKTGKPSETLVK